MNLKEMFDLVNKEKRKKQRIKDAQKIAVGMGVVAAAGVATGILLAPMSGKETRDALKKKTVSTVETLKDMAQKNAETVKESASHVVKEAHNVIKDIHKKTVNVKNDIKDGFNDIEQNVKDTAEAIKNEVK